MRILLIKAVEDVHPYSVFARALARELTALGHEAVVSDQTGQVVDGRASVEALVRDLERTGCEAVVSFSSYFGNVTLADGRSLFDAAGVRFLGWQLDHPIYAPQSLARALHGRFAVYANESHRRFAQALGLPGRGTVLLAGGEAPAAALRDPGEREWPILVAATFNGEPQALWAAMEDSPGKRLLEGVVGRLLDDREASLLDAFEGTVAALGLEARLGEDPDFDDQMIAFLREPLTFVRHLDRVRTLRAIVEAGLPVTICGGDWRGYLGARANVTYLDQRIDFPDMPAFYGRARIVLNLNAGNGACERAIQAALAGAAVVSDDSATLRAAFGAGEIAWFHHARPDEAVAQLADLLESGRGEAMAARAHATALGSALWRHRAAAITDFLQGPP